MKKKLIGHLIAIGIMAALMGVIFLLKENEWIAEYVFARGISRAWTFIIGHITSIVPFSIFEISIFVAIITGITMLVIIIIRLFKKKPKQAIMLFARLVTIAVSVAFVYTATATGCYNRYAVDIETYNGDITSEQAYAAAQYFILDYNLLAANMDRDADGHIICPYSDYELSRLIREEFKRLDSSYFNSFIPLSKPFLFSRLLTENSLLGISFMPLDEPNYNAEMHCLEKAATIAHETAHALGVMREADANLVAAYITLTSENKFIRYSGYIENFWLLSEAVRISGVDEVEFDMLLDAIDNRIYQDKVDIYALWAERESIFSEISAFFNDLYLKFQGEEEGIGSYSDDYDVIDTGEIDEEGQIIYEIEYSPIQKLFFNIYLGS